MKASRVIEAFVINAILILALLWVTGEQAARAAFADSKGLTFTVSRSLFTYVTTLSGTGGQLSSPPTLDWEQVIIVALVLIDLYYILGARRRKVPTIATAD